MSRSQSPAFSLLFALVATACTQQGAPTQGPAQIGSVPALAPADIFPYRFSGGSGSANFTAKGKDGTCSGTLMFNANTVYVDVKANGDVDPGILASATLTGLSTCDGKPFEFPELFDLKSGSITKGTINNVLGVPPVASIYGSFKMSGPVCDATIHSGRFIAQSDDARVQVDSLTITHVQQSLHC